MQNRLFHESVPTRLMEESFAADRLTEMMMETVSAYFTLLWTRGNPILIAGLYVRLVDANGNGSWQDVLKTQRMDDDGEFSIPLGAFRPGDRIEVMVTAMALEADVSAVGAITLQPPIPGRVVQVIPAPPAKAETMPRGTTWAKKGAVTV